MTIMIELPEEIESNLTSEWGDLPRAALEALAVEGYRQHKLTRSQVGRVLGFDPWRTEAFLKEREAYLDYDADDLESDRETHERVLSA